jgi:hypothetical protein
VRHSVFSVKVCDTLNNLRVIFFLSDQGIPRYHKSESLNSPPNQCLLAQVPLALKLCRHLIYICPVLQAGLGPSKSSIRNTVRVVMCIYLRPL